LIFLERVTGLTLGQYLQQHIFTPLNLTSTAFTLTPSMRSRLAGAHERSYQTNQLSSRPHVYSPALQGNIPNMFDSAGSGLFSTASEFSQILATILNDGVSPTTRYRILKKETIDLMFQNQVSAWMSNYAGKGLPIPRPDLAQTFLENDFPVMEPQGWGLSFQLFGDKRQEGRTEAGVQFHRAFAPGLMNCFWGMDREKGVGGVLMSQILPFADPIVLPLWLQLQGVLYGEAETGVVKDIK
jgi:CubicO group peptidase (beta-lactamase class C family)